MPIFVGANDRLLRMQLSEIAKSDGTERLKIQIQQMDELAAEHPHSVTLKEEGISGNPSFNCYEYAFGITNISIHQGTRKISPGRDFVQYLVENYLEEILPMNVENGDYVVYSEEHIEHAGKVENEAVVSKWGKGHVWRHGVYEVPGRYGDFVRFFRRRTAEVLVQALQEFYPNAQIERVYRLPTT